MASNHKGCAVVYCNNTYYNVKGKKKLSFFGFPKDSERSKQWVVNCRTANLDKKTTTELNSNYMVCGEHFEDRMFMNVTNRNSLVHNAVPTIFNFPQSSTAELPKKRKPPTERDSISKKVKAIDDCAQVDNALVFASSSVIVRTSESIESPALKSPELTPQKAALISKLEYTKASLNRARVALHRVRRLTANLEKVVQVNIESLISGQNVIHNLKQCVLACVDVGSYHIDSVCEQHQTQQREYLLNLLLRVRIHHFIRIRNRELQQIDRTRKLKCNRKAKKVMNC